ncbi:DUF1364 family protein [Trinickia violacea]|uniref:DUF1364 family protein n=1 Tax=Trinickia violacea TaxID=2571746 RepID=A0A4P8IR67_9BURK|nr:DUF1364 family protein [Trinickia violacea]QCP50175.1 DUF1364 family protein [Trinickia violacea]
MKRSAPLQRHTPLARTGFKRKEPKPFALTPRKQWLRNSEIRRRVKRPTVADGSKYLAACRGEECYLLVPGVCCSVGWAHESVVDCHSNQSKHGKGGALKAKHEFTVPGCGPCHYWLDFGSAPRELKVTTFDTAYARWEPVRARKMGLTQPVSEAA